MPAARLRRWHWQAAATAATAPITQARPTAAKPRAARARPTGKAAHLAGAIAANTVLPVIGIPVKSSTLDGLYALLATVQMPTGIPVATVAIDGAANAAILAAQMLALSDPEIDAKLEQMKADMDQGVKAKDAKISAEYSNC